MENDAQRARRVPPFYGTCIRTVWPPLRRIGRKLALVFTAGFHPSSESSHPIWGEQKAKRQKGNGGDPYVRQHVIRDKENCFDVTIHSLVRDEKNDHPNERGVLKKQQPAVFGSSLRAMTAIVAGTQSTLCPRLCTTIALLSPETIAYLTCDIKINEHSVQFMVRYSQSAQLHSPAWRTVMGGQNDYSAQRCRNCTVEWWAKAGLQELLSSRSVPSRITSAVWTCSSAAEVLVNSG
ncbi:hypothetical protein CBL_00574 [Carabus blaptoides fortunei]